jgi:hypothetical protein
MSKVYRIPSLMHIATGEVLAPTRGRRRSALEPSSLQEASLAQPPKGQIQQIEGHRDSGEFNQHATTVRRSGRR